MKRKLMTSAQRKHLEKMHRGTKEEKKRLDELNSLDGVQAVKIAFHDFHTDEQFLNPEVNNLVKNRKDEEELLELLETNIIGSPDILIIDDGDVWFEEIKFGKSIIKDHQFSVAVNLALAGYRTRILRFSDKESFSQNNKRLSEF